MQFRIYDRQTLKYKDGGYVQNYTIDDDYIVNNNSTISILKELNKSVVVGDTIALIKTSGAYHKGTITTLDNSDLSISYKADRELFNDNLLNPLLGKFDNESSKEGTIVARFGIEDVANILSSSFVNSNDWAKRLPLKILTQGDVKNIRISIEYANNTATNTFSISYFDKEKFRAKTDTAEEEYLFEYSNGWKLKGESIDLGDYGISIVGNPIIGDKIVAKNQVAMLWTWDNESINVVDWLIELFKNYNLSLSWTIDFDGANEDVTARQPLYVVTLSAIIESGKIIKDNVKMQTITYTEKKLPESTVCIVLDTDTKEIVKLNSGTKNLLNPNVAKLNKSLAIMEGNIVEQDDDTSNISGYIKLNVDNKDFYDGVRVTLYTFSCKGADAKIRNIVLYDESKKQYMWQEGNDCLSYQSDKDGNVSYTIRLNTQKVAYCRISYDNSATEVQFEKGGVVTKYEGWNIPAIYYLCVKDGNYYVSLNPNESEIVNEDGETIKKTLRVFPSKSTIVKYKSSDDENTTPQESAENTLIPSKFNQAIEIRIGRDSKMFDFDNATYGDIYTIINEFGTITSNYTGRKEESANNWMTLYFGLGRQNYTDIIQLRMQKQKYEVVYN